MARSTPSWSFAASAARRWAYSVVAIWALAVPRTTKAAIAASAASRKRERTGAFLGKKTRSIRDGGRREKLSFRAEPRSGGGEESLLSPSRGSPLSTGTPRIPRFARNDESSAVSARGRFPVDVLRLHHALVVLFAGRPQVPAEQIAAQREHQHGHADAGLEVLRHD